MRCFVTGGAGFIGSNLVDRLLKEGHHVTVYDNFSSGEEDFIRHHLDDRNFKLVRNDLLQKDAVTDAMEGHDIVFHLAANPDVLRGLEDPTLDFNHGTVIMFNVLEAMRANAIKKIVFSSSGTVYGYTEEQKVGEDFGPILPVSLYGANKVAAEALVSGFAHIFGYTAYIFRFANIIGKRQNHGVIYDFINKLKDDPTKLEILGDGRQIKHYVLVDDLMDAILFVLNHATDAVNYFNVSNQTPCDVNDIAKAVIDGMGLKGVTISHTGGSQGWKGDVPKSFLSADKLKKLGWEARYDSAEAIAATVKTLLDDSN